MEVSAVNEQEHVLYHWKTVFEFSPELIKEFISEIYAYEKVKGVKVEFKHVKQSFSIDGPRGKVSEALSFLKNLTKREIEKEVRAKRNVNHVVRMQRAKHAEFHTSVIEWTEDIKDEAKIEKSEFAVPSTNEDPLIGIMTGLPKNRTWKLCRTWAPKAISDFAKLIYPPETSIDVCAQISKACNCYIVVDWFQQKVKIHANDTTTIGAAIRKLNKVEEIFNRPFYPQTVHLINPEDKLRFGVRLYTFKKQSKAAGKTTLFSNKKYYADLKAVYTMRLLQPDPAGDADDFKPTTIKPREIGGTRTGDGPRDLAGYTWKARGTLPTVTGGTAKPRRPPPGLMDAMATQRQQANHADELSTMLENVANINDVRDNPDGEFNIGSRPKQVVEVEAKAPSSFTTKRHVRVRGSPSSEATAAPILASSTNTSAKAESPLTTSLFSKPKFEKAPKSQSRFDILVDYGDDVDERAPEPLGTHSGSFLDDLLTLETPNPGGINELFVLARPTKEPEPAPATPGMSKRRLRQPKPATPAPAVENVIVEKKQAVSEVGTRKLRQGNRQKSSNQRHDTETNGIIPMTEQTGYNLKKIRSVIENGLEFARFQKCRLTLEAKLGRVVYFNAPKSLSTEKMTREEWDQRVIDERDKINVVFTDRITTDEVDVDHVIDRKLNQTESLFYSKPHEQTVLYELVCDYRGRSCTVRINAETFEMDVVSKLETWGTAFYNCPIRSWDARFALQARRVLDKEVPAFQDVLSSLHVPAGTTKPEIIFQNSHDDLIVKKALSKRASRYNVFSNIAGTQNEVNLVVTEVQELILQEHTGSGEIYRFLAAERDQMILHEKLYYTFTLVPTNIEKVLRDQENLEIGEEAKWTVEEILGSRKEGVIPSLVEVVNQVVKRIDDVGFGNKGRWEEQRTDGY